MSYSNLDDLKAYFFVEVEYGERRKIEGISKHRDVGSIFNQNLI